MKLLMCLGLLAIFWARPAAAEQPTGFDGFGWGTPRGLMTDVLKKQCKFHNTLQTLQGGTRFDCTEYVIPEFGPVNLWVDFIDDRFTGYRIVVPRHLLPALRSAAPQILHTPAAAPSTARTWQTRVEWSDSCLAGFSCLKVTAY